MHLKRKESYGFTLIELLVVIAIIGILASVIMGQLNTAREKGRIAAAKQQLENIRTGIALLLSDTGRWPNGCEPEHIYNISGNEVALNASTAGILTDPGNAQPNPGECDWTLRDGSWKGPYMQESGLTDPWGRPYWFDNDYEVPSAVTCPGNPDADLTLTVIVSQGPTQNATQPPFGGGAGGYSCDDIYVKLSQISL